MGDLRGEARAEDVSRKRRGSADLKRYICVFGINGSIVVGLVRR